jgi:ABC-type protease/lipase transport system fused ATPase/permease subunit
MIHPWPHPLRPVVVPSAIAAALKDYRRAFWSVVPIVIGEHAHARRPLYVPQVYDRVLASYSVATSLRFQSFCFCTCSGRGDM